MKKRILLADDEMIVLKPTRLRLEHEGFEVVTAVDGEEVVQKIFGEGGIDLILLDIIMPKLDGFEVVKKLKENPATAKIPVILFTASSARWQEIINRCVELGVSACLRKPFQSKELIEKIRQILEKEEKSDAR